MDAIPGRLALAVGGRYGARAAGRLLRLRVAGRFVLAAALATGWLGMSAWLALPWLRDSAHVLGPVPALIMIVFVAWVPGWLVAFLAASLVLDRRPGRRTVSPTDALTIIVAARNEADRIAETIARIAGADYAGPLAVVLADNGSTDGTADVARRTAARHGLDFGVVLEERPGKSHALNAALATVSTELVVTLDADTLPHPAALRHLVSRLHDGPPGVEAVAGDVLVRNSRDSFWTRLQEWDYFLGIAAIKRMQGMYESTLVAQGAFSLYRTHAVRDVGGWPDAIGEDIVVTWELMQQGGRVEFEPLAVAFTGAPTGLRHLARQRARWARGMIEGLRAVPPWRQPYRVVRTLTAFDLVIPLLDLTYTFVWMPGLVLALFGVFWVVGPYTVLVLPLTLLVNGLLYRVQRRGVFDRLGLRVRRNRWGFLFYVLIYQMVMSPVAVYGYGQELLGLRRRWK